MVPINMGIVMNGPTPIMFDILRAEAWSNPRRRERWGAWPLEELIAIRSLLFDNRAEVNQTIFLMARF